MDDVIPEGIEVGTLEYWKARARQWQRRCQRAEQEKTELINMLSEQRQALIARREAGLAVQRGENLGGQSGRPRGL